MDKTAIALKLEQKKARLSNYLAREIYMLSTDAVQSYGVGSRNVQRYSTDLAEIRRSITTLEAEVEEGEGQLAGQKPRRAAGVVPRDW